MADGHIKEKLKNIMAKEKVKELGTPVSRFWHTGVLFVARNNRSASGK